MERTEQQSRSIMTPETRNWLHLTIKAGWEFHIWNSFPSLRQWSHGTKHPIVQSNSWKTYGWNCRVKRVGLFWRLLGTPPPPPPLHPTIFLQLSSDAGKVEPPPWQRDTVRVPFVCVRTAVSLRSLSRCCGPEITGFRRCYPCLDNILTTAHRMFPSTRGWHTALSVPSVGKKKKPMDWLFSSYLICLKCRFIVQFPVVALFETLKSLVRKKKTKSVVAFVGILNFTSFRRGKKTWN